MTDKIMSFDEWFKSEPNLETREKSSARIAWDACNEMHEYQYNEEIDSLKAQLKEKDEQIEKMKCCENCVHFDVIDECTLLSISCIKFDKWKIKE